MTFTQTVKNEIIRNLPALPDCCRTSCLSALMRSWSGQGAFASRHEHIVNFAFSLLDVDDMPSAHIDYMPKNRLFVLRIDNAPPIDRTEGIPEYALNNECCARSYLIGLFLGCGTIRIPIIDELTDSIKGGYHLENDLPRLELALDTIKLYESFGFDARLSHRRGHHLVYFKDSDAICDILTFFHATVASLEAQNSIAARNFRAVINRTGNCISANIDKTVAASVDQITAIEALKSNNVYDAMSDSLKETAQLRLDNPDASLDVLVSMHAFPISKSGVKHRLDKLISMAKSFV